MNVMSRDRLTPEERAAIEAFEGEAVRIEQRGPARSRQAPESDRKPASKTPPERKPLPAEMGVWPALCWAFGTECAQMDADELGATSGGLRRAMSPEAVLEQRFMLGNVRIDTSPGRSEPPEDAQVTASVVRAQLRWDDAVLMADRARAGQAPDAMVGVVQRLRPEHWTHGRGGPVGKAADAAELGEEGWRPIPRRNRKGFLVRDVVRYTPCKLLPSSPIIAGARRAYLDWWGNLLTLQVAIRSAGLRRFVVSGEMPPITPWID